MIRCERYRDASAFDCMPADPLRQPTGNVIAALKRKGYLALEPRADRYAQYVVTNEGHAALTAVVPADLRTPAALAAYWASGSDGIILSPEDAPFAGGKSLFVGRNPVVGRGASTWKRADSASVLGVALAVVWRGLDDDSGHDYSEQYAIERAWRDLDLSEASSDVLAFALTERTIDRWFSESEPTGSEERFVYRGVRTPSQRLLRELGTPFPVTVLTHADSVTFEVSYSGSARHTIELFLDGLITFADGFRALWNRRSYERDSAEAQRSAGRAIKRRVTDDHVQALAAMADGALLLVLLCPKSIAEIRDRYPSADVARVERDHDEPIHDLQLLITRKGTLTVYPPNFVLDEWISPEDPDDHDVPRYFGDTEVYVLSLVGGTILERLGKIPRAAR
jgi:hypothetical protein